jgi:hypothetical protein
MSELILHDYRFSLVPKVAENDFIKMLDSWYEGMCDQYEGEDFRVPFIAADMLYHAKDVHEIFQDFFYEVKMYAYARGRDGVSFDKDVFPIDDQLFIDLGFDEEQAYYDVHCEVERAFFMDMQRYLERNRMFYQNEFFTGDVYHNIPIREVW